MKKKILGAMLVAGMLGLGACGDGEVKMVESESFAETEVSVERADVSVAESVAETESLSITETELDQVDTYEAFLKNEALMYEHFVEGATDGDVGYSLSAIMDRFKETYYGMQDAPVVEYAYIDCGNDGVTELAVRFTGMGIYAPEDDSSVIYVIKEIDGQLELCYSYETWARSETRLNQHGYVTSGGSNGASNYGFSAGYIDGAGKWNYLYYMEEEADINQLTMNEQLKNLPVVAANKSYDGVIYVATTTFEEMVSQEAYLNTERFYAYYVDGAEGDVYTDSVYKEIFDEAGVKFYLPEEIDSMILEKELSLGITEEIKNAPDISWEKLSE
ncbi:MAG: hypothetical protein E7292_07010 [Lachnospiraceae bacterium]|nr:hypothetical protein [Lachnospiraceae bacterium]